MSTDSKTYGKHLLRYRDPAGRLQAIRAWKKAHPLQVKESNRKSNAKVKTEALTHYGKNGRLMCCWNGCDVTDQDLLTLDHINDDGARHRERRGQRTGVDFYRKMRLQGWPLGFQTLCWNHQWKKEILRRHRGSN